MTTIVCEKDRTFYTAIEAMAILCRRLEKEEHEILAPFVDRFAIACGCYWIHTGDSKEEVQLCGLEERIRNNEDYAVAELHAVLNDACLNCSSLERLECLTKCNEVVHAVETLSGHR